MFCPKILCSKRINISREISSAILSSVAFLFYKPEAVPGIFKNLNADHQRMFDLLKESQLKWIAVLPPHIAGIHRTEVCAELDPLLL